MGIITDIIVKIKEMTKKMLGIKTVEKAFNVTPLLSSEMENSIKMWSDLYTGHCPWLREPTFDDPTRITSLGLPQLIASEKARTALIEFKSEITPAHNDATVSDISATDTGAESIQPKEAPNSDRAKFLNYTYTKLKKQLRTQLEYAVAKGGLVIKPYVTKLDVPVNDYAYSIDFDYIQADAFYPLSFDTAGKVTEGIFVDCEVVQNTIYRRVEYHKWQSGKDIIINKAYKCPYGRLDGVNMTSVDLGEEIPLTEVESWKDIEPVTTVDNISQPLFAYLKMPGANTIDSSSPLGMSVFHNAISLIKDADMQYSRYLWEYEGGQMAIDIDRDALYTETDTQGNPHSMMGQLQRRLYRTVDLGEADTYNVFAPPLRDASYLDGLNTILMRIEDVTALSRGTLAEVSEEAKTATELKILKQRSYQSNSDIQQAVEDCLNDVIYAMNVLCDLYDITPSGEYDVSYEWDDSIMTDTEADASLRMLLQQNGVLSRVENRMWYLGETREQAVKAILQNAEEERIVEQLRMINPMDNADDEDEDGTPKHIQSEKVDSRVKSGVNE